MINFMACVQVAFLVGILYSAVGFLRLAWLTNFISHSVIAGFMSGAAVTIALQQVCKPASTLHLRLACSLQVSW